MKLITPPKRVRPDDTLGQGIDVGLVVVVFFGLGALLDMWLDTTPIFMIVFVLLAAVGVFYKLKNSYDERMDALAAERLDKSEASTIQTVERPSPAVGEGP